MSTGRFSIPADFSVADVAADAAEEEAPPDAGFARDVELDEPDLPDVLRAAAARAPAPAATAEGRLQPGRVTFDEVRNEYLAMDPDDIEERHRPPYEWTATSAEMERVVNWTDGRIAAQNRVRLDNTYKFLTTYAALRNKELARLQAPTAARRGAFRDEQETQFRWLQLGPEVLERADTGATVPGLGGPSPRPPESPPGPGAPPSLRVIPPPPPLPPQPPPRHRRSFSVGGGEEDYERPVNELTEEGRRQQARMDQRQRLARISGWLERPEIMGIQGLSAEVYGHVETAFVDLTSAFPQYAEVEDHDVLAGTDVVAVRNYFARLAAISSMISDFYNSPVTSLDKNKARLEADRSFVYRALNMWRYDKSRGAFVKRSADEVREEADSRLALPSPGAYRYARFHGISKRGRSYRRW
jgi:hypothetical protein